MLSPSKTMLCASILSRNRRSDRSESTAANGLGPIYIDHYNLRKLAKGDAWGFDPQGDEINYTGLVDPGEALKVKANIW